MKTNSKQSVFVFLAIFVSLLLIGSVALAQEDLIGGQDPNTTLNQIFEPIKRFVNWVTQIIETIILRLFDWDWIRGIFIGFFHAIDGFVERITGNNLAEVFRIIGDVLAKVFYFIVDLIKSLWPS